MLPGLAGVAGIARNAPVTVSYGGSAADAPPFSQSMAIGTAAANRRVVVCAMTTGTSAAFGSCTVAGQSCTLVFSSILSSFQGLGIYVTDSPVTSGTTATVAWNTADSSGTNGVAFTYAMYGAKAAVTDTDFQTFVSDPAVTLDIRGGGVAIALAGVLNASATCTWTNATEGGEISSTGLAASVAAYTTESDVIGRVITSDWSANSGDLTIGVAFERE